MVKHETTSSFAFFFLFFFLSASQMNAQFKVAQIFSDHMVLQRNHPINIWGWGDNGETITVNFQDKKYSSKIENGKWKVTLPAMKAGGPFSILFSNNKTEIKLTDVLIGDVWICSGQSNMEWAVKDANNAEAEIMSSSDNKIRHFKVPLSYANSPEKELEGGEWEVASPETTGDFTAVGFYFARELRKHVDVPIGLLNSSWGGSRIEPWMNAETLNMTDPENELAKIIEKANEDFDKQMVELKNKFPDLSDEEKGMKNGEAIWAAESFDDSDWTEINTPNLWETQGFDLFDGIAWYRKTFELNEEESQNDALLFLAKIDDTDATYVNGKLVGEMIQEYNAQREYKVPANILKKGKNTIAVRVEDTGGGGGIYGDDALFYVQTNNRKIDLTGKWKFKLDATLNGGFNFSANQLPTLLYNKMIHPIIDFPIKGALWYQGESNAGGEDAKKYSQQFKDMINMWRDLWKVGDFPFLYVQLANFMEADELPAESDWAVLRESQTDALELKNTAQAVIIDIGEAGDIHPRNKQDVGLRLSLAARNIAYGQDVLFSSPIYNSHKINGQKINITFDHCGNGLVSRNKYGYVNGFAVAGEDKIFYWAKAEIIDGNTVSVFCPKVPNPKHVRYGWGNNPDDLNLYNSAGLPACPFRTD